MFHDRTEPSTGTTTANSANAPNGVAGNATTPLLDTAEHNGSRGSNGLWQRNTASAPNGTVGQNTVSNSGLRTSAYPMEPDNNFRYRSYQEQFDV
ncbi:hypothetical protein AAVH_29513 [Aphelenchoides avenae]|nr:hypothetical protein AAVH_29513 [Aphelenchus avenae]